MYVETHHWIANIIFDVQAYIWELVCCPQPWILRRSNHGYLEALGTLEEWMYSTKWSFMIDQMLFIKM